MHSIGGRLKRNSSVMNGSKLGLQDRGLLPNQAALARKLATYNMSHAKIGPADYNSNSQSTLRAVMRSEAKCADQKNRRFIDLTKWRSENSKLIEKGIGL